MLVREAEKQRSPVNIYVMLRATVFSGFFFLFQIISAQQYINGTVRSAEGEFLPSATVMIANSMLGTATDASGKFKLHRPTGSLTLHITYIGYKNQNIQITEGENASNLEIVMQPDIYLSDAFIVYATRAHNNSPLTYENISGEEIKARNTGRDLPYILEQSVSTVSTSDAGAGIGYTGMRIRGVDQANINVTINGIALNDAESHGVYYVDLPDFSSSLSNIQIQRGVGTSTNGAGAFGATVNLQTEELHTEPYAGIHTSAGSFGSRRATVKFGSGMLNDRWYLDGRMSTIHSDGYIDRATTDMSSYYIGGGFNNGKTSVKLLLFGGKEETYQAWYGVDSLTMATDRRFNFAGAQYDANGNITGFYDNEIDHYDQDHAQLHLNQKIGKYFRLNLALHGTYGRGYYEQYRQGQSVGDYGYAPFVLPDTSLTTSDLVVRQWLKNFYYGATYNINFTKGNWNIDLGGGINRYDGDHYGEIIWAQYAGNTAPGERYYFNNGLKDDMNAYFKITRQFGKRSTLFFDYQQRLISYDIEGTNEFSPPIVLQYDFNFSNPKIGYGFQVNDNSNLYYTIGIANREPNRSDILNSPNYDAKPEQLIDNELGYKYHTSNIESQLNLYYMYYHDQLVLTGAINDVGEPIRDNVGKSYRAGLEASASTVLFDKLRVMVNFTFAMNKNLNYVFTDPESGVLVNRNTDIAFSPSLMEKVTLEYQPAKWMLLSYNLRVIGDQYMDNTESEASKLPGYSVSDFRVDFKPKIKSMKEFILYTAVYNIFDYHYASNGYMYAGTPYYFPQAGINFMAGLQVNF